MSSQSKNGMKHSMLDSLLALPQNIGNKHLKGRSIYFGLPLPETLIRGWLTPLEAKHHDRECVVKEN